MNHGVPEVWGAVLIGGRSRRMGQPKHLLRGDGGLFWIEHIWRVLTDVVDHVAILGGGQVPDSLRACAHFSDVPGLGGPLAGILAAFRGVPRVSWLVVACDMPDVTPQALRWLLTERQPGDVALLPSLAANGHVEPMLAYYDRTCHEPLENMAASGLLRLNLLKEVHGVRSPQPPVALRPAWRNVNTPEEMFQRQII